MKGNELKRRREALGISRAELARVAKLHPSTVGQIETGRLTPYPGQIEKLEAAFAALEAEEVEAR